jgi:general secretion pathway protein A
LYLEYWGLREEPFENIPNPKFFYSSKTHAEALTRTLDGLTNNKGCVLLTGDYGCGKTALVRKIIEALDPGTYEVALINYPIFSSNDVLREVLFQFGIEVKTAAKLELFDRFSTFGYENLQNGKQNVLVIDEAQLIEDAEIFEQLRLLVNVQIQDKSLISIVLVGQPELRERATANPQFHQRIGIRYHMERLPEDEVVAYIRYRLEVAGATREFFTPESYAAIVQASQGVPRRINNICNLCLLDGWSSATPIIDESMVAKTQ